MSASWKTVDDFYEHSNVATVRLDDLTKRGKTSKPSRGIMHLMAQFLSFFDKRFGLRHLFLLSILTVYSFLGGYCIYYFEANGEAEAIPARKADLERKILEIVQRYKNSDGNQTLTNKVATLKKDYIDMLNTDGVFKWSTYYKTDETEHWKWTLSSSFFYSMNVYTTIGYGSIAPETFAAKCFTVVYGIVFCPITWIIIRDIGQLALVYITTLYARLKLSSNVNEKQDRVFMLPFWICVLICGLIMGSGTIWVYYYDAFSGPPGTGMPWFLALYFTFQTFTTIGLGDVMPNNIPFDPIISSVFFFSLPMLKVLNRMCYLSIENGVHGAFEVLSNELHCYCHQTPKPTPNNESNCLEKATDAKQTEEVETTNQLTIRSIATFMQSNADVYGGRLGQVNLRAADIENE